MKRLITNLSEETKDIILNILLVVVIFGFFAGGCYNVKDNKDIDKSWEYHGDAVKTKVVEIEGHKYVIMDGYSSGGIVHAESCNCKRGF